MVDLVVVVATEVVEVDATIEIVVMVVVEIVITLVEMEVVEVATQILLDLMETLATSVGVVAIFNVTARRATVVIGAREQGILPEIARKQDFPTNHFATIAASLDI